VIHVQVAFEVGPEIPFYPSPSTMVRSLNTLWLLDPILGYCRLPLQESPRLIPESIDNALEDLKWVECDGFWLLISVDKIYLRALPSGRSSGSVGVVSGSVQSIQGDYALWRSSAEDSCSH